MFSRITKTSRHSSSVMYFEARCAFAALARPCAIALLLLAMIPTGSQASMMLTFDDLGDAPTVGKPVPNGYGGLNWNRISYRQGDNGGYQNGAVSAPCVAFGPGGGSGSVTGAGFHFDGAYFTGAWRNGLNIQVDGYRGGQKLYSEIVVVDYGQPTWFDFNYASVDKVTFTSFGGYDADPGDSGTGSNFVIDNFTTPEPAGLWLFGLAGKTCWRRPRRLPARR